MPKFYQRIQTGLNKEVKPIFEVKKTVDITNLPSQYGLGKVDLGLPKDKTNFTKKELNESSQNKS